MPTVFSVQSPLPRARFGGSVTLTAAPHDAKALIAAAEADPAALPAILAEASGLLLLPGMQAMADEPELLVRLSRLFGTEVEDYRRTLTPANMVHATVPEIFVVANAPPVSRPPPKRPDPPFMPDGSLPVQFPHRRGWHTDQSYRRPPPDISLFLAVVPVPKDQGQTLFADGTAAYAALPPALQVRIETLEGIHCASSAKRNWDSVRAGIAPEPLQPHQRPQRQPLVRTHPVTGRKALYLCEFGQMDWVDGPIAGMSPGPDGEGGKLLTELMSHMTQPRFVYVHEWSAGDLVIWDNRCLVHAATWFDVDTHARVMWRTTVSGNPGPLYAGEHKSWVPQAAE
ncbi:MAG TPA: TauD/TfdA family dioxygenase [Rhodopila sp.]|uniref:TauD/TfdA dioxygenase family protein n=1 Tax=Rhodopila sp. TaxID=2480087 RepID=UPI002B9B5748|nr:TauD/TfdA family dioxygenase [Rhodopila sp.]HVY14701.1 TauD/TfdA family dioxygenase [Rhodopila sp.]